MRTRLLLLIPALLFGCGDTFVWDDDTDSYGEDDDVSSDDDAVDDDVADDDDDTGGDNTAPVADAGGSQSVQAGDTAYLDGSASHDPDGDDIDFLWAVIASPNGSSPNLSGELTQTPTLSPSLVGDYDVELTVTDPGGLSDADVITVSVTSDVNNAPVADAGPDQTVTQGDICNLDGSASHDVDGDPLTFWWTIAGYPGGSPPSLSSQTSPTPNFIASEAGTYSLDLIVNDGQYSSVPDSVTVTAEESGGGDDPGCLECYASLPPDIHTPPLRASHARRHQASATGLLLLFAGCLLTVLIHRRR